MIYRQYTQRKWRCFSLNRGLIRAMIHFVEVRYMKDIPFFPTQHGVAGLILREIPYRQEAYIRIQDVQPGELSLLLRECLSLIHISEPTRRS